MSVAFLAAAALLPALWLQRVSLTSLARARHVWLGLVALLVVTTTVSEPWLAVMGVYLVWWWREPGDPLQRASYEKTRMLAWWLAIGALWFIALHAPQWAWVWLPTAWGVWAWLAAAALAYQWWAGDPAKVRAWFGMRSVAGAFLALVLPLLPLWAWPGPLVGLWLSGPSWVAVAALGVSSIVRWPDLRLWGLLGAASGLLGLAVILRLPLFGRAIGEWSFRGDSFDSMRQRLALLRLAWRTRSWMGTGPGTTGYLHLQAAARGQLAEATGTLHNEPAQLVSEYGVAGALALALFVYRVAPHLAWGDRWSACVVAGAVIALGSMALRVPSIGGLWLLAAAEVARG